MRYRHGDRSTLHSAGRERHAHHGRSDGMPVFAQDRCDERTLRKVSSVNDNITDYVYNTLICDTSYLYYWKCHPKYQNLEKKVNRCHCRSLAEVVLVEGKKRQDMPHNCVIFFPQVR